MRRILLLCGVLGAVGCGPVVEVSPPSGSAYGHFAVTVKADALTQLDATAPWSVTVGGIAAYEVTAVDERTVRFTVQGHPEGGPQKIVVSAKRVPVEVGSLKYLPPVDARLSRLVAFGASLTMGSQDASVSQRSQLHGPASVIARQAGAYLGVPLIRAGYLPSLVVGDIDPDRCRPRSPDIFGTIGARVEAELMPRVKDSGGNIAISKMRVDASLISTNVAIGGFRVRETAQGAQSLFGTILEHVVWDPRVDVAALIEPPAESQLDRVVGLEPTLALSTDLIGNDYNNVNLYTDGIPDLNALTPVEELRSSVREVVARLDQTGAEVFLATGPDNTVLPSYPEKVQRLKAAGFSDEDATGWLTAIRARIVAYNEVLREETRAHPKIHLVDLHARVATVLSEGVTIDGQTLKPAPYGGLLSLDMMHFSDTGYAVLANFFLEEMNASLGTKIPLADLSAIHATDPYSAEALQAAGLSCAGVVD
ncbi:MAG: hypothetical protein ACYC8T_01230 [Myxococcaceae bacterium]